jgi:FKBP-type peptidyl-prolyl cis-trans isomerase 2
MKRVEDKDWVIVEFTGKLDSGEIIDSTKDMDEPIQFQVGGGKLLDAFEKSILGMAPGEVKAFRLEPEQAYGIRDEEARLDLPRSQIPEELDNAQPGEIIALENERGEELLAQIVNVEPETMVVDLNHPLAGYPINFEVELLTIVEEPL